MRHAVSRDIVLLLTVKKVIDVTDPSAQTFRVGEQVMVIGETSMGMMAVTLAFVFPFILLILSFLYLWQ